MRVSAKLPVILMAAALVVGLAACGKSEKTATPEDAKAQFQTVVRFSQRYPSRVVVLCPLKAAAYLKELGPEKAFDAFTNSPEWKDGDLYVWADDKNGVSVAHGFQPELVGTNELDVPDADGKYYMHDVVAVEDQGWVDYHWKSPTTGEIVPKTSYIVHVGDYFIGVGAYKY